MNLSMLRVGVEVTFGNDCSGEDATILLVLRNRANTQQLYQWYTIGRRCNNVTSSTRSGEILIGAHRGMPGHPG